MPSSGNFARFNPLKRRASSYADSNIDNANQQLGSTTGNAAQLDVGFKLGDGKFYYEVYAASIPGSLHFGVCIDNADLNNVTSGKAIIGMREGGNKLVSTAPQTNSTSTSYGSSFASGGAILAVAMDFTNSTMEFFINNSSQGSFSWSSANDGSTYYPYVYMNTQVATINTGQDSTFCGQKTAQGNTDENGFGDFYYTPPSGLAMCSANLPISSDIDPAETDTDYPSKQFNAITYTGTGSNGNNITGLGFQPDLVWFKNRGNGGANYKNNLADTSRGITKVLYSDASNAEETNGDITSFDSDGFTVGGNGTYVNASSQNYVAWCWRANGGTTASNSDGATTTTVQANTKAGFSIVEWPQYTPNSTFGHGLSEAPTFIISKLTGVANWAMYHSGLDSGKVLYFTTSGQFTSSIYNSTAPTSSVFSLGASYAGSGAGISYCWHDVKGFQKFGTYVGNGNTDGPFIYTGFRPRMLFIKRIDSSASWYVLDTARDTSNPVTTLLNWDTNSSESGIGSTNNFDVLSNGLKIRTSGGGLNGSGGNFIFGAWGDQSATYSNAF